MTDPVQSYLGVKASTFLAALLGATIAAAFGPGPAWLRLLRGSAGLAVSVYLTPFVVERLDPFTAVALDELERASAFVCGLLAMSFVGALYDLGQRLRRRGPDLIVDRILPRGDR